jgi:glycosyltransferase involved in cell wall biosynthesis
LSENRELRSDLGNYGKKIAEEKFSWKNKIHEYLNAAI